MNTEMKIEDVQRDDLTALVSGAESLPEDVFFTEAWHEIEQLWRDTPLDYTRIHFKINHLIKQEKHSKTLVGNHMDKWVGREEVRSRWGNLADYLTSKEGKAYESMIEAKQSLKKYFQFYNQERKHQTLKATPDRVYYQSIKLPQVA